MTIERQAFFDVMASFPSGVAIVTTLDADGTPRGLTTTAVCSVSADPPTILVCVDRASRTLAALRASGRFVVNFAGEGGSELCLLFASKEEDKFRDVRWRPTDKGLPLLHEAVLAWAECSTERELEIGDHVVLVAEVDGRRRPAAARAAAHVLPPLVGRVDADPRRHRARRRLDPRDRGQRPRPPLARCRDVTLRQGFAARALAAPKATPSGICPRLRRGIRAAGIRLADSCSRTSPV